MDTKIIAIVGETGSGKDTFCNILKESFSSVLSLRFSDPLTQVLGIFFDDIKKEDQQWLANSLRDRFGEDVLMKALSKRLQEVEKEIIVVNGMRVKEEFDFIKKIGGVVVYITLDAEKRWQRVKERGEKKDDNAPYEKFLEIDRGRTEQQIKKIGEMADIVIDNSGTLEDLKKEVLETVKKMKDD